MSNVNKVILLADDLWVMISRRTPKQGPMLIRYYETPSLWVTSPAKATIFTSYEAAEGHLKMLYERDFGSRPSTWADGSKEEFDIVPLYAEMKHTPNSQTDLIHYRRKTSDH